MLHNFVSRFLLFFLPPLVRFFLFLRYRVEVVGLEKMSPDRFQRGGGVLFLPNHPAELDPVILEAVLWKRFKPRPLVVEHFYNLKGFHFFMRAVKALPLPAMDRFVNKWQAKKVKKQFDQVAAALKSRENFLIYPSGKLKVTGRELIGGASFVHDLLQACPQANVVLVRTTGLWGSRFSRALTGSSPDFGRVLWDCLLILLKNGMFFAPRRPVRVEIEHAPEDFPYQAERLDLNKYLESWYNQYPADLSKLKDPYLYRNNSSFRAVEPISLVSYAFWKEEFPQIAASVGAPEKEEVEMKPIPRQIQHEVFKELSRLAGRPADQIERNMYLSQDLGLDSLDIAEVYVFLDHRYDVTDLIPGDLNCVEEVLQAAAGFQKSGEGRPVNKEKKFSWPKERRDRIPGLLSQQSIQEAFLLNCDLMGSKVACVDAISGVLTYRRLKLGALLLSNRIREIPGTHVGVMLPSSAGTFLVVLGILLAGKVPVMINWTAGVKALDHAVDVTQVQAVITSERFLERLQNGDLGKMEELFLFLEEISSTIGLKEKVKGICLSCFKAPTLLKRLQLDKIAPSDPAVLLFTSGTETLPKGVPLSHTNILSNQKAAISCVGLKPADILYGVLPPFHSFGFSVTGILPLLAGLRVCYAPDPTDSHGMASDIERWRPTLFCCAPSFIRALFRVADPKKISSLDLVVSGAEKAPQELFDYVKKNLPASSLLEGYGITECSPIVTLERPGDRHVGVGKALPGVELVIFDSATLQPVAEGQEGEIGIRGPSVFKGYFGISFNPFVNVSGKQWYASGDRGRLDSNGNLLLLGRLKRFVKIGGEMVSLGGLEEELLRLAGEKKWVTEGIEGPPLAVTAREKESDKPEIVLFTTFSITKEDVNAALQGGGYSRLVKIGEVKQLDEIPLTGTGKTHYRFLDETYL